MKTLFLFVVLPVSSGTVYGQDADKGSISPELVGKWCYYNVANGDEGRISSSCVTLNANGTYEFYIDAATMAQVRAVFPSLSSQESDDGTWWIDNGRLTYNSSTHGRGSFRLQKMNQPQDPSVPMLVLNGVPFVSPSPRDPW